jgi:hydrogenase maturation factor
MSGRLTITLAGAGRAKSFVSVAIACNDRNVSGLACRPQTLALLLSGEVQE